MSDDSKHWSNAARTRLVSRGQEIYRCPKCFQDILERQVLAGMCVQCGSILDEDDVRKTLHLT